MSRRRIDPRASLAARRVAGGARPRFTIEAGAPSGRPRRDPRAEQAGIGVMAGARLRLDRSGARMGSVAPAEGPGTAPGPTMVDDPAFLVLAVADAPAGRLSPHDRQVLGAARLLAGKTGAAVLVAPVPVDEAGASGADRVVIDGDHGWDPDGRARRIAALIGQLAPRHALFAESTDGADLARRVAVLTGEALFAGAELVTVQSVGRPARGRRVEQRSAPPRLISIQADIVAPHQGPMREARRLDAALPDAGTSPILTAGIVPADPAGIPLVEADFVVAAGNGISDFDAFRVLAAALGATPGASRVVCDAGLMPRAAQVGASGTVLSGTCYFALGIAGAPQHLQGITRVEHVVAVNTDLHAAMIERAGLAIVADAQAIMPALIAALKPGGEA